MSPGSFGIAVAASVFAGGAILLRDIRLAHRGDMIGAVVGLLTLFSALVLGLLIWTAYGVYSGQNLAIQMLARKPCNSISRSRTTGQKHRRRLLAAMLLQIGTGACNRARGQ
jgi:hypothetical protein